MSDFRLSFNSVLLAAGLIVCSAQTATFAAVISNTAADNATVKPTTGPRSGTSGKAFFNVEGDSNSANASYGVVDFAGTGYQVGGTATGVNTLTLTFTESNAGFTHSGSVTVYLASDSSATIQPGTQGTNYTVPNYTSGLTPEGIGSTTAFGTLTSLGSITLPNTGATPTGGTDSLTLSSLSSAVSNFLAQQINNGSTIRFVVTPDDGTTAGTFAGSTNNTAAARPAPRARRRA